MKRAVLATVIIVAVLAWPIPRLLIDTGFDELPPDERAAAEAAIDATTWCISNPIADAMILMIEVVRVDDMPGREVHAVTLRSYTIFGIELWTFYKDDRRCSVRWRP